MTRLKTWTLRKLSACLPAALRREDGTATMEFVLVIPVIMAIFMASFESGLLMTRSIMLEQAVDMTMRELRLGHYPSVTNKVLKEEICKRTIIFPDCEKNIKIEMQRVSTVTWNMPDIPQTCINRREDAEPVISLNVGQQNDLMLLRVCVALDAMFPATGIALNLPLDDDGGYGLVTRTAFVTEPTS
jgi:hypothetical protein